MRRTVHRILPFVALLLLAAPAAADVPAGEAVGLLNAQRAANGIPAGLSERADWSSACAKHNDYQRANGGGLTHQENPANPGYTVEGAWAGQNSVLSQGDTWRTGNPWETAPIHLMQLLAPRLTQLGVDDRASYVCATTWPGYAATGSASPVVYSYPGDGATRWRPSERASEGPFTPGDKVGLPQPTETGPYLYALVDGPGSFFSVRNATQLTAASLTGPQGPVEIRTVASDHPEVGPYLPAGAMLIPVSPLQAGARYTASASFTVGGAAVSRTWSFTTAGPQPGGDSTTGGTPGGGSTTGGTPGGGSTNGGTPGGASPPGPTPPVSVGTSGKGPTRPPLGTWPARARGRTITGKINCGQPCRATAALYLKGRKRAVASKSVTLAGGQIATVTLTLPRKLVRKVRNATVVLTATNALGQPAPPSRFNVKFGAK